MNKYLILIIFFIQSFAYSETIKEVDIKGNDRISKETILMFSEIDIGAEIDQNNINDILKKLYKTNFFESVEVSLLQNKLIIKIKEFPIVQNVNVKGIKKNSIQEKINENIFFKERTSFNEIYLNDDRNNLKKILKDLGYYFSKIQILVEELDDNKVNVTYEIDLGDKSKIKKITFLGKKIFKDNKLKSVILSEEYKFWKFISGKKYLNETLVNYDKNLLKNFYLNKGFYNVKINTSFAKILNQQEFELIYNIDAGEKIYFNEFTLNLPKDFEPNNYEKINKIFNDLKGKYYSLYNVEKILNQIETITVNDQFESVDVQINETITSNKIDIIFNINEARKFYVKKINILGNNVTDEKVIRNQIEIDEGDPFNEILYSKSINNIKSLNFFSEVKSDVLDSEDGSKIINISIDEKPTGEIFAGAGTGTAGTTVSFGVRENNYLGKGIKLDTNANISAKSVKGQFIVENPNFKNSDKSLNFKVESSETDRLSGQGYKSNRTGFSTGTRFEYFDNLFLGLSLENFAEKVTVTSAASDKQKKNAGSYFDSFLGINFDYDKRNQKFATTSGFFSYYSIDIPLLSETGTLNNSYNYKIFSELYENNVTTASILLKSSFSINGEDIKLSERLFVPGSRLRGFERGKIGPKDGSDYIGGNYLTAINFSSTIPKLLENTQNMDVSIFFDAANLWGVDYDSSIEENSEIRSSVGLGLNLLTPIGPLSFSYAQPITHSEKDVIEKFRFNLGTTF